MVIIRLKQLRFYNVLSYGANLNIIDFTDGITWLKGPNGAGKSTIIEALHFLFFNSAYRDISHENLINSFNKKGLVVEGDFDRIDSKGTTEYTVMRGLEPKKFMIKENGEPLRKEAGMHQFVLENEILGFDSRLFTNVISLNTLETKPFLDMKPDDKRKLIESIITLDISKLKKKVATELTSANAQFLSASNDSRAYSARLIQLDALLKKLDDEKSQGIADLETEIKDQEKTKTQYIESKNQIVSVINKITESGKVLAQEYESYKNLETRLSSIEQVIAIMGEMQQLRESFTKSTEDMVKLESELKATNKEIAKLDKKIKEKDESLVGLEDVTIKLREAHSLIFMAEKEKERILKEKDEIKVGVPCPTCAKPSTEEDGKLLLDKYRRDWKSNDEISKKNKAELEKLNSIQEKRTKVIEEQTELKNELSKYTAQLKSSNDMKKNIEEQQIKKIVSSMESKKARAETLVPDFNIDKDPIEALQRKYEELKKDKPIAEELNKKLMLLREELSSKKTQVSGIDTSVKLLEDKIVSIQTKIENKKKENAEDSISITKKQIADTTKDLQDSQERITKFSDEIEILNYMATMLGDNGIKKSVIGAFVPVLNKAIENNLRVFDLPFSIEFDESLNYRFCNTMGTASVYHGLSQGQKRKLHFSISMAFRDFVSMIGDFSINILFLDEVLDISVDDTGLDNMVEILKSKVKDIGGIYLMTHRGESFSNDWDHILEISHDGNFSDIRVVR